MKRVLTKLSLLHPFNRIGNNREYPQVWYMWNKNRFYYRPIVFLCSILTGHELSKTEWEYGRGNFRDMQQAQESCFTFKRCLTNWGQ